MFDKLLCHVHRVIDRIATSGPLDDTFLESLTKIGEYYARPTPLDSEVEGKLRLERLRLGLGHHTHGGRGYASAHHALSSLAHSIHLAHRYPHEDGTTGTARHICAAIESGEIDPAAIRGHLRGELLVEATAIPGIGEPKRHIPEWKKGTKTLTVGGWSKKFKKHSRDPFLILDAFAEMGWPEQIDDPLPNGKRKDVTRNLNRMMGETAPIRFTESGESICLTCHPANA